ncbi:hypothetical protein [Roseomonas fluvialis]|uniref:APCDD1 domain-containing protein n=1 Tax=Roseomonas fluvialis TaxID=1750527 RepID=A0ABN6P1V9_9PROT|nr:hypothetical protein [Roseomonas fluvialis]BDG72336.1 hypothetical protein Rmf_22650 [Roseomonas fluvialis]
MIRAAAALLGALALATPAVAQEELRGTWRGDYICAQGNTALALTIEPAKDGRLSALFHFEAAPDNPDVPTGCYEMQGGYTPATRQVTLGPQRWLRRPPNYVMVGLEGHLSADGGEIQGRVQGPGCSFFRVERAPDAPSAAACRAGAPLLSLR